eukprot:1159185-Pelagomonas_calceolata.AAC.24
MTNASPYFSRQLTRLSRKLSRHDGGLPSLPTTLESPLTADAQLAVAEQNTPPQPDAHAL